MWRVSKTDRQKLEEPKKRTLKDLIALKRTIISKRYKMSLEQITTIHTLLVKEVDNLYACYDSRNTQKIEEFKL